MRNNDVNKIQRYGSFLCFMLVMLTAACAPVKELEVWKSEEYTQSPSKILLIALTQKENIRKQFENVLADQLGKRGVEAIPGHKVLPPLGENPDRDLVVATVKKLGVDSVLVTHSISKEEIVNHQYGGVVLGGVAIYNEGWYGYSYGYSYNRVYDSDLFTISSKLYDVDSRQPAWSYLSQIKIDGSKEGAVNLFIPTIIEQMDSSQLLK